MATKKIHTSWKNVPEIDVPDGGDMVIQLDPGGTTGVCVGVLEGSCVRILGVAQFFDGIDKWSGHKGLIAYEQAYYDVVGEILSWSGVWRSGWNTYDCGVEDFILGTSGGVENGGRGGISPVRITSSWFAQWMDWDRSGDAAGQMEMHSRGAGVAKHTCDDSRLVAIGGWIPGKQHARDAIRHMYTYCKVNDFRLDASAVSSGKKGSRMRG